VAKVGARGKAGLRPGYERYERGTTGRGNVQRITLVPLYLVLLSLLPFLPFLASVSSYLVITATMGNVLSPQYTYEETTLDLGPGTGKWRGTLVDGKVKRFLRIPYALPPIGDYRWRRPRSLPESYTYNSRSSEWSETSGISETSPSNEETHQPFDTTQFGAVCPQVPSPGAPPNDMEYGEDCLSVNIWMPVGEAPKDGWPVLVWFHGEFLVGIVVLVSDSCVDIIWLAFARV
jgi:hypothetical protein